MLDPRVSPPRHARPLAILSFAAVISVALFSASPANAQVLFGGAVPGVYLDIDGKVRNREVDEKDQLNSMRLRMRAAGDAAKNEKLAYLSLPKLFAEVRALREAGKEVPEALKYLGGMTQLRYVFVFPDQKDLVIVGPCEPWIVAHGNGDAIDYVVGKRTGRPILQLDDLVVAMRTAREGQGTRFGCGIYPSPESLKIADDIAHRMARNTRAERLQALRENLGPQEVRIFGQRADTRFAYICVAADYEMKRMALGVDKTLVPNLGNAMDNTRSAANKFWFLASYEPLLVSKDGNSYQIRGPRLAVDCGGFDFDPRGATETAKRWTTKFSKSIPAIANTVMLYAELQNIADEAFLANLMRVDRLAEKVDWDNAWVFDDKTCPVARIPTPKTCETVVSFQSGSLVAGGVDLSLGQYVSQQSRQADEKDELDAPKNQLAKIRDGAAKSTSETSSIFTEK
jgi:hypothetical protein